MTRALIEKLTREMYHPTETRRCSGCGETKPYDDYFGGCFECVVEKLVNAEEEEG